MIKLTFKRRDTQYYNIYILQNIYQKKYIKKCEIS